MAQALLNARPMRLALLLAVASCADPSTTTTTATISRTGGLAPSRQGSSCQPMDETFTFDASTRRLTWRICESPDATTPFAFRDGDRVLDDATAMQLDAALHDLRATAQACGGDIKDTVIVDGTTWNNAQCSNDSAIFEVVLPLAD